MKLSGVFLATLGLAAAFAQNPTQGTPQSIPIQSIPIQGVVLDKASRSPIAGATVNVVALTGAVPTPLNATADGGGHFEVSVPGGVSFSLAAYAAGYQASQQQQPAASQNGVFIEMTLDRLSEIRGRLVDDETKKPLAGVAMTVVRADILTISMSPMAVLVGQTTQEDGSFSFKNLNRGDYHLRIQGAPTPVFEEILAKDLAPETRDKALEVPEPVEGYGIVMWPGENADVSQTQPFKVATDVADVGEIRLRRRRLHNLSGVLAGCEEGAFLQVLLLGKNVAATVRVADLDTACDRGFRILNLPEGTFTLVAQGGPPRRFISQVIDGGTRGPLLLNVSSAVAVQFMIEVEGVSQDNFPQDLRGVNIALTPENAPVKIDSPDKLAPYEYEAHLFGNERYRVSIIPPPAYYLKQLSYDGVALPDITEFTAVPGALSTIRVLLSNHPGAVEVQAPARSTVYLLKEGAKLADIGLGIGRTIQPVGADGKARFAGLGPGRYRTFLADGSVPISQAGIDTGLIHSTEVTVEEGQTASVTLSAP